MLVYSLFSLWGAACRGMMQMHCNDHLIHTVSQPWLELLHYQGWCWLSPLQQYVNSFRGWFSRKLMMTWFWSSLCLRGGSPGGLWLPTPSGLPPFRCRQLTTINTLNGHWEVLSFCFTVLF
jgi:hypothetical protein